MYYLDAAYALCSCIFAELISHDAFFQGENPQNQLEVITAKLGCPLPEKLQFVQSSVAL
jgi:hypothetical protein